MKFPFRKRTGRIRTVRSVPVVEKAAAAALLAALLFPAAAGGGAAKSTAAGQTDGEVREESAMAVEGKIRAVVGIPPVASLLERIGGERVSVSVLVKSGQDPHTFQLTPKQMIDLGEADLYYAVGLPFERRLIEKLQGMNMGFLLVQTDAGVEKIPLDDGTEQDHRALQEGEPDAHTGLQEGPDGSHGGIEPDPHIWLSPSALKIICTHIYEGLVRVDAAHEQDYKKNLEQTLFRLNELDLRLKQLFAPYRGRAFYVYHPAFGYLAHEYGLVQVPVEIQGKSPTPRQVQSLIERARAEGVKIIFV
jgi:zinc transport system substrate-binding protein